MLRSPKTGFITSLSSFLDLLTRVIKVKVALGGLDALGVVELPVEGVLAQRDDLALVAVVLLHHRLHDPLAHGRLKNIRLAVQKNNLTPSFAGKKSETHPLASSFVFDSSGLAYWWSPKVG